MSIELLPPCLIRYILSFTDILTTIKFSITNKIFYKKYYPVDDIVKIKNALDKLKKKSNKHKNIGEYIYHTQNIYFDRIECNPYADLKYCKGCESETCCARFSYSVDNDTKTLPDFHIPYDLPKLFTKVYCGYCFRCNNSCMICNKNNNSKDLWCHMCKRYICSECDNKCKNPFGFSCTCSADENFVCNECSLLNFYCTKCKLKKCLLCLEVYGGICKNCK